MSFKVGDKVAVIDPLQPLRLQRVVEVTKLYVILADESRWCHDGNVFPRPRTREIIRCIVPATNERRVRANANAQAPKRVCEGSQGEVLRLRHTLDRMRGAMSAIEGAIANGGPIGNETAEGLQATTTNLVIQIAKHDAFLLMEESRKAEASS